MGILQDYNLMYRSPRRVLFVHNKSATGRYRGDSGGLGGWTGAKIFVQKQGSHTLPSLPEDALFSG